MFKYIRDSLLLRAGLAMGLITFLAVMINDFVVDIDHMVRLLEEDAESSIHLLGLIQVFILFLL